MCINRRGNLLLGTFDVRLQVEDFQAGGKKCAIGVIVVDK